MMPTHIAPDGNPRSGNSSTDTFSAEYESANEEFFTIANKLQKLHGVDVIFVSQTFESPGGYVLQKEGVSLYRDTDHLSETGAKLIAPLLTPYFQTEHITQEPASKSR